MLPAGLVPIVTRRICAKAGMYGASATAALAVPRNRRRVKMGIAFLPVVGCLCLRSGRQDRCCCRVPRAYCAHGMVPDAFDKRKGLACPPGTALISGPSGL